VLTLEAQAGQIPAALADAYIAPIGERLNPAALVLARELRRAGLRIDLGDGSFRIKKSFETGNKLARKIVLLGEDEVQSGMLTVKNFASGEQTKIAREELASALTAPHE
jgi:histidyl-tRNA synthetase